MADEPLYNYAPNKPLAVVATVLLGIALLLNLYQTIRSRSFRYQWPFLGGLVMEVAGYGLRRYSADVPENMGPYLPSQICIIIAPALLAASIYMSFGRCVLFVGEELSPIRPRWVTRLFVTFDVFSFIIQAAGGSLYSGDDITPSTARIAKAIIIAGFVIQIVSFGIFMILALIFFRRAKANHPDSRGAKLIPVLEAVALFILLRCIFRLSEFATADQTGHGPLLDHEVYLWVFETVPVVIAVLVYGWWHPSRYIPNDKSVRENKETYLMQQTESV